MSTPEVETCTACKGAGFMCSESCHQTGRIVWGGTLPTLTHVADRLRELVREDIGFPVAQQALDPAWHDELAVFAEACDRHDGRLKALQDKLDASRQEWAHEAAACLDVQYARMAAKVKAAEIERDAVIDRMSAELVKVGKELEAAKAALENIGALAREQEERAETAERALRIAEASARLNAETSRQQSIEWREQNGLLHAEIRRLQRQLRGEAVGA